MAMCCILDRESFSSVLNAKEFKMNGNITLFRTAETWKDLSRNARMFNLDQQEMDRLKPFFDSVDPDFFQHCANSALTDFPMEAVQKRFSETEMREFLFLCIVANYDALGSLYRREGFPRFLYSDMVPDFRIWADTMKRDFGNYAMTQRIFDWAVDCLTGKVKAFGRLQCNDIHLFPLNLSIYRTSDGSLKSFPAFREGNPPHPNLTTGDRSINIHIPAGTPLLKQSCILSLKQMCEFSEKFHPDYDFKAFVCYSWLLDPQFRELLKPGSNILDFQSLGHILPLDTDDTEEVVWRIWGAAGKELAPDQLPVSGSMERAVSAFLKRGGRFREGLMVIFRDELPALLGNCSKKAPVG